MPLPNFLIIGAAKAATTSLASLLMQHPQAIIVRGKEPHFFAYPHLYRLGLGHYETLFSHFAGESAIGDASTSYSRIRQHPKVIARIKKDLRNPGIIYMVRHPIERIESAYIEQMTNPQNAGIKSIGEAIQKLPMMVDSSRYWETFSAYSSEFGENNIKVVWFKDFTENPIDCFSDVCNFLNIDTDFVPALDQIKKNTRLDALGRVDADADVDTKWDAEQFGQVKSELESDTRQFLQHFKKPADYWGSDH